MITPTHIAFNHSLYLFISILSGHQVSGAEMVAITVTAPLPDIDTPNSIIGRTFPVVSRYIDQHHGHRTLTHSIWAVFVIAILLTPLLMHSKMTYIAGVLGYFFHIVADTFTKLGPMFFYPKVRGRFVSLIPDYRMVTGSTHEKVLFGILLCSLVFMYPLQAKGLLKTLEAVVGNPKEEETVVKAQTQAQFQHSLEDLNKMLKDGVIDRMEYNTLALQRGMTMAEIGASSPTKTEGKCFAFIERIDERALYINTSPSCVFSTRNPDGLFPVKIKGFRNVPSGAKIMLQKDVSMDCEGNAENGTECTFYQDKKNLNEQISGEDEDL